MKNSSENACRNYPFGMRFGNAPTYQLETNNYLYNGKELQDETDWYDYGFRQYDPQLGRWHAVDPMAEMYYSFTPYNYVMNNPMNMIDPNGMYAEGTTWMGGRTGGYWGDRNFEVSSQDGAGGHTWYKRDGGAGYWNYSYDAENGTYVNGYGDAVSYGTVDRYQISKTGDTYSGHTLEFWANTFGDTPFLDDNLNLNAKGAKSYIAAQNKKNVWSGLLNKIFKLERERNINNAEKYYDPNYEDQSSIYVDLNGIEDYLGGMLKKSEFLYNNIIVDVNGKKLLVDVLFKPAAIYERNIVRHFEYPAKQPINPNRMGTGSISGWGLYLMNETQNWALVTVLCKSESEYRILCKYLFGGNL